MGNSKSGPNDTHRNVDEAFKELQDHLKELEQRRLIDTAEERWKRDRKEKRSNLRDPKDPATRN